MLLSALLLIVISSAEAGIAAISRSRMRERQASGWGLGLKIQRYAGHTVARHDGWFAAHRSHLLIDARDGLAVIVLTNSDNASPKDIAEALFDAALEAEN